MADQDFSLCPKDGGSGSHQGEIWPRWMSEPVKLSDLPGWRTGQTNENCYRNECLIGNWNEERYDISRQKMIKRLPSDYEHYFDTTYHLAFDKKPYEVPAELKNLKRRHPRGFPAHQPELDSPYLKAINNSWQTTNNAAYIDPKLQRNPALLLSEDPELYRCQEKPVC